MIRSGLADRQARQIADEVYANKKSPPKRAFSQSERTIQLALSAHLVRIEGLLAGS
jgi:hypothetical protein